MACNQKIENRCQFWFLAQTRSEQRLTFEHSSKTYNEENLAFNSYSVYIGSKCDSGFYFELFGQSLCRKNSTKKYIVKYPLPHPHTHTETHKYLCTLDKRMLFWVFVSFGVWFKTLNMRQNQGNNLLIS